MSNPTKYSGCKEAATSKTNEAFELDFLPGRNSADSAKGNITQRCQNEKIYEEEVDFETALEKTGFGKFNIFLLLLSFPASCASTFDTASLPYVLPTASCDLNLTGYDRGLLNGAIYTGMLTSSFIWGSLSDTFGRQKLLAVGYLLDACFSIGASLSQNKWAMFAFKFLSGCAIAGPFSMIMTYMSEMFSKKYRDSIVLSSGIYMSLGGVIQPMIAIALIPKTISWEILDRGIVISSWRIFLILSATPALISGILTAFCVESPKFLLAKGNKTKALQTFQYMYSVNTGKPRETYPVKSLRNEVQTQDQRDNNSSSQSFVKTIGSAFTHPHLKYTFLCCGLQFLALNSLNTIRLWLPLLFHYIESIGGEPLDTCEAIARNDGPQPTDCSKVSVNESIYMQVMYTNLTTAIFMSLSSYIVKRVGKKILMVCSFVISAAIAIAMPWLNASYAIYLACLYLGLVNAGVLGVIGLAVELFPTSIRTLAVSLTMTSGRIGVVLGSIALPLFLSFSCWAPFMIISLLCTLCAIIIFFTVPGRTNKRTEPAVIS